MNFNDHWNLEGQHAFLSASKYHWINYDDEKLAFLHQKELVLNQTDTENILAAVRTVRDFGSDFFSSIEKALDSNAIAAMALMGQKLNPIVTTPVQDSIE